MHGVLKYCRVSFPSANMHQWYIHVKVNLSSGHIHRQFLIKHWPYLMFSLWGTSPSFPNIFLFERVVLAKGPVQKMLHWPSCLRSMNTCCSRIIEDFALCSLWNPRTIGSYTIFYSKKWLKINSQDQSDMKINVPDYVSEQTPLALHSSAWPGPLNVWMKGMALSPCISVESQGFA